MASTALDSLRGFGSLWQQSAMASGAPPAIRLMEGIRDSPVEVGSLSHYLYGFSTIPRGSSKPLFGELI